MASGPISSWKIDVEKMKTVTTVDSYCSHEIIKSLAPWKKSSDKPRQHIKKQRHHFANKGPYSQCYGFPVVMYGCENWTIKKAECQRTDAFRL